MWPVLLVVVGIGALIGGERPNLALSLQLAAVPEVVVTASELRFSPDEITLPSTPVNLTLRNDGVLSHDLTISALGVRIAADSGTTSTTGLRDLPRGRYEAFCGFLGQHDA